MGVFHVFYVFFSLTGTYIHIYGIWSSESVTLPEGKIAAMSRWPRLLYNYDTIHMDHIYVIVVCMLYISKERSRRLNNTSIAHDRKSSAVQNKAARCTLTLIITHVRHECNISSFKCDFM